MSVCALNQAPVPVQEALLQVSGARWAADEMLAVAELSSSSADGLWYMTHCTVRMCQVMNASGISLTPTFFFFFFFSMFTFLLDSVNSNGLWWRRFLFSLKCFHGKIWKGTTQTAFKEKKKSTFKSSPLKCGFCYKARVSWWSVMICLLWAGLLKWSSSLELSDGISYQFNHWSIGHYVWGTAKWVGMFSLRVLEVSLSVCERLGFVECALGSAGFSWQASTGFELRLSQVCIFRSSDSPGQPWNETLVSLSLSLSLFHSISIVPSN